MNSPARFLNASEAAGRLGVSAKALRLYEQRRLIAPGRSAAGWRVYGPEEMRRARDIVALRKLGFSLAQIGRALEGDSRGLASALAAHRSALENRRLQLTGAIETIKGLLGDLARGDAPTVGELARLTAPVCGPPVAFDLPYPWGGERFELGPVRPLNYIVGPLGSGKTRLAQLLAETIPDAVFLDLDRTLKHGLTARAAMDADPALRARVDDAISWLVEDGAATSDAFVALIAGLERDGPSVVVVDMIERGLDQPTQEALIARLRSRDAGARPIFMLTRSNAILDLTAVGEDEAILFCPANHSPPSYVAPHPGASGYDALESCLASPEVRARTDGVIAWRPQVA